MYQFFLFKQDPVPKVAKTVEQPVSNEDLGNDEDVPTDDVAETEEQSANENFKISNIESSFFTSKNALMTSFDKHQVLVEAIQF